MSLFFRERDIKLLKFMSSDLVERVMDIKVLYFKIDVDNILTNFYGDAKKGTGRVYHPSVLINALVLHDMPDLDYQLVIKYNRLVRFKFLNSTLLKHNVYPEVGDVVCWNRIFFEITKVTQLQLLGGKTQILWSKVCLASAISNAKTIKLLEQKAYLSEQSII